MRLVLLSLLIACTHEHVHTDGIGKQVIEFCGEIPTTDELPLESRYYKDSMQNLYELVPVERYRAVRDWQAKVDAWTACVASL